MFKSAGGKRLRIILPFVGMATVGLVGAYILTSGHAQPAPSTIPPSCPIANGTNPYPTLGPKSKDQCVRFLQWTLNNLQFTDSAHGTIHKSYGLALTGTFDKPTANAVKDFQNRLHTIGCTVRIDGFVAGGTVPTDGTVDPMTWYFLTTLSNQPGFHGGGYQCGSGNPLLQ